MFTEKNGDVQPTEVKVGLASNEYVEIRDGLTEGDAVRLAVSADLKLKLPQDEGEARDESDQKPKPAAPTAAPTAAPAPGPTSAPAAPARAKRKKP